MPRPDPMEVGNPYSVVGSIDSAGAIHARVVKMGILGPDGNVHGAAESRGKRWRWSIFNQEFESTLDQMKGLEGMTPEEFRLVRNWLERKGYADENDTDD